MSRVTIISPRFSHYRSLTRAVDYVRRHIIKLEGAPLVRHIIGAGARHALPSLYAALFFAADAKYISER